jgi:copper resistance protein B
MHIKTFLTAALLTLALSNPALADDMKGMDSNMKAEHGGGIFHMFRLETDYSAGPQGPVADWDFDGWIGGDENKLWLRSEGENSDGKTEQAEFWALYSRNIATFWDAQAGIRTDTQPHGKAYLTLGFEGLAPYYFETEAHLFIGQDGILAARLREENDFLLTQKLITQPYAEINLSSRKDDDSETGAGFTNGEIGLQTRYEFTRKFAPYVDVRYERKFGATASMAESDGEDRGGFVGAIGLRLMF